MKEKEPHMDDYVEKKYIKAKEPVTVEKSSEEEFLQDIWKDKVRETREMIAKRRYNQIMFIKNEMQKVASVTTGEEEQESGDDKPAVNVARIMTIKNQLQEIIYGIKELTESFGETLNFEEKKDAILKETEKAFDEYLTIKLENVRTQNEDILVSQMGAVTGEQDETIPKKIPVLPKKLQKKMEKMSDSYMQPIVDDLDGKPEKKRRPLKSKDKRISDSDSTTPSETRPHKDVQGALDREVAEVFLEESKKYDTMGVEIETTHSDQRQYKDESRVPDLHRRTTIDRTDHGLPDLPQRKTSDTPLEMPTKIIGLQPTEIKARPLSTYSKRQSIDESQILDQQTTSGRKVAEKAPVLESYQETSDITEQKEVIDEKDKDAKLKIKTQKAVSIHSEDVTPSTSKGTPTVSTDDLTPPLESDDSYSHSTEGKQKRFVPKRIKIPKKETFEPKLPTIDSQNRSLEDVKQSLSEKKIMAEVSRRLQLERERKYAVEEVPEDHNSKKYLKNKLGYLLIPGLVDILRKRPADPCDYLRNYITENKDKAKRRHETRKKQEQLFEKKSLLLEIHNELHKRMVNQKNQLKILDVLQMDEPNQQTTIDDMLAIMTESDVAYDSD
ncbi:uncharacterized protein LOC123300353 [Chrysoperla carnea]|uniref:uncharacterized protein LOC123300353 n=1 Tax=Chrysoperla carnea TaxID=189513 RepID=UPI001D080BF6|nr:uncharacterized protein LOC123300353 [Chrysoperla carnea]